MRHLLRTNWLLVATIGLALFYLSPVLKTGYLGDDAGNSLVLGILRYYDITIFQLISHDISGWLGQALFRPLGNAQTNLIFYLIPNLVLYKGFVIGLVLLNLILFHQLIRRICPVHGLPELSLLVVIMLFQFRLYHDPILAYNGLLQVVFFYVLASLLSLCNYLETAKRVWLIASVTAYLLGLLTYEITYPMFLLHVLCILQYTRSWKQTLKIGVPFIGSTALCAGICLFLRCTGGRSVTPGYRPNTDMAAYFLTLSRQLFAALPLSYSLTAGREYLPHLPRLHHVWPPLAVFVTGFSLAFFSLNKLARSACDFLPSKCLRILPLALSLWILPALLVCLSPRYQNEIYWGVGQIQVYIECYGVGLILASTMAVIVARLAFRTTLWQACATMLSIVIATVLSVTCCANHSVVKKWAAGWHDERLQLETALRAGLVESVPDGATLIAGHRYPWWHDVFGAYFYCLNSGKRLHFPSRMCVGPDMPLIQGGSAGNHGCLPSNGRYYEVLDYRIDARLDYVFLCELAEPVTLINGEPVSHKTGKGCLFVRRCHAKRERLDEAFLITADADGSLFSARSQDLKLLRCGREWGVYGFETGSRAVDARSLRVVLLPGVKTY